MNSILNRLLNACLSAGRVAIGSVVLGLILVSSPSYSAGSEGLNFVIKPQRCVTLREGQPCYVKLKVNWNALSDVTLCIYDEGEEPLACWEEQTTGTFFGTQYLYETTRYTLRDAKGVELAESTVIVAWVYKSRRARKRWRLF